MARLLNIFDKTFLAFAQLSLLVMMISISTDALGRYLFNAPLVGNYEFTSLYLMVIVTFLGMPATYASGGMVRLDVLAGQLSRLPWQLSERLNTTAGALVFGFIAWHASHDAIEKFVRQDTTFGAIQFPIHWSYVWVPLGCGLMALRLAYECILPSVRHEHVEGVEQ